MNPVALVFLVVVITVLMIIGGVYFISNYDNIKKPYKKFIFTIICGPVAWILMIIFLIVCLLGAFRPVVKKFENWLFD